MISVRHVPSGTSSFYGFDPMSNTRLLTSAAGAVTDRYRYNAFGEELSGSGSTINPHRFGGQVGYYRDKVERVYIRARHYAPAMGRWVSPDPIRSDSGDSNFYRYVYNNPVDFLDPTGLRPPTARLCVGVCGANIDDWIPTEIKKQLDGVSRWRKTKRFRGGRGGPRFGTKYVHWANGNQRYKDRDFFQFSKGLERVCAKSQNRDFPCSSSVTLCGLCVRSAILGNIMYGFVGGYLNIPVWRLIEAATGTKQEWEWLFGRAYYGYDNEAYRLGRGLWNRLGAQRQLLYSHNVSQQAFCQAFKSLVAKYPRVLREARDTEGGLLYGDYNDLSSCSPCKYKTMENAHGGSMPERIRP